jgi:hypothetical protein
MDQRIDEGEELAPFRSLENIMESYPEITTEKLIEERGKEEKLAIKKDYKKVKKNLSCCNKFYLWLRKNYVHDILFK